MTNFKDENKIKEINVKYLELIQKTKKLYFQDSTTILNHINIIKTDKNNQLDNTKKSDTDILFIEFKTLIYLLN